MRPLVVTLALALTLAPREALAEEALAEAASQFDRAVALYRAGDLTGALREFQGAYAREPHPLVLFNIAQLQKELGRLPQAYASFEKYLAEAGPAVSAERRTEVQGLARGLLEQLGQVVIETPSHAPATVAVDGQPLPETARAGPLPLSPGRHTVEVRVAGCLPHTVELEARPGEVARMETACIPEVRPDQAVSSGRPAPGSSPVSSEVQAVSPPEPAVQNRPLPPPTYDPSTLRSQHRPALRRAAYAMTAVGTALLGTTLGLYLWNAQRHDQWQAEGQALAAEWPKMAPHDVALRERQEANAELGAALQAWSVAEWVLLGVGLATAGVAVALWILGWSSR